MSGSNQVIIFAFKSTDRVVITIDNSLSEPLSQATSGLVPFYFLIIVVIYLMNHSFRNILLPTIIPITFEIQFVQYGFFQVTHIFHNMFILWAVGNKIHLIFLTGYITITWIDILHHSAIFSQSIPYRLLNAKQDN